MPICVRFVLNTFGWLLYSYVLLERLVKGRISFRLNLYSCLSFVMIRLSSSDVRASELRHLIFLSIQLQHVKLDFLVVVSQALTVHFYLFFMFSFLMHSWSSLLNKEGINTIFFVCTLPICNNSSIRDSIF